MKREKSFYNYLKILHKACIKEFSKDRNKKDGLTSACRECNNNREKKRKENGGDFTKEQKLAAF